ncbi:MAG: hypothetical protein FDX21_04745 [Chlorobium sp.]|nr:MAG: hypothetical protein FDX21_04745 [Chlorobium sp.]
MPTSGSRLAKIAHGIVFNYLIYTDFRNDSAYFTTVFDLILTIYQLPPNHPAVADLRESLNGLEMR